MLLRYCEGQLRAQCRLARHLKSEECPQLLSLWQSSGEELRPDLSFDSCTCSTQDEHTCIHEKTVYCAVNRHFPDDLDGGPTRVRPEHFGKRVVPIWEYEDPHWMGSSILQTQGRSRAHMYLYNGDNNETCLVKIDKHVNLAVRCTCGHFGLKAICCEEVANHWNGVHPENQVQLSSQQTKPAVVVDEDDERGPHLHRWPWGRGSEPDCLCVDWPERADNREFCLPLFCLLSWCCSGRTVMFLLFYDSHAAPVLQ